MRVSFILCTTLLLATSAIGQQTKTLIERPQQFEIGDLIFFDFGPPFNYYNLYTVRPTETGTEITRFIFSRPGDKCSTPMKLELSSVIVKQSVSELLGAKNPCEIPEKQLKKEAKRCKHCLIFSGSNVIMRVACGDQTRLIRSDILDRDMFDPRVKTPENTAWTMTLLGQIDKAIGPGVMEKPVFPAKDDNQTPGIAINQREADLLKEIEEGKFDSLFPAGRDSEKLSEMAKETHDLRPNPFNAKLRVSKPFAPENPASLNYPPLARATKTQGEVSVAFEVLPDGSTQNARILSGHKLLNQSVLDTVGTWKFPAAANGKTVEATIEFSITCLNN